AASCHFRPARTESSLTRMHMRLNERIYSLIPAGSKAGAVAQVFDRACQGLSRGRALGRRCAGGKAALHFLAACWSRYKWPHIKEAYESTGFFESRRLTMSIGNKRIAVIA